MEYIDQSADALRFYLVRGDVDVQALTVLASTQCEWQGCTVEAGILGASHYLRIDCVSEPLFEIFACAELQVTTPLIKSGPLGAIKSSVQSKIGSLDYTFTPRLLSWDEGEEELGLLANDIVSVKTGAQCFGLSFEFPSVENALQSRKPFTFVWGEYGKKMFHLRTAHCYPNEGTIVFTNTTIARSGI